MDTSADPSVNAPNPFEHPASPGPSGASMADIVQRQRLILHRLQRVHTSITALQRDIGAVRQGMHVQNDQLHRIEMVLEDITESYLNINNL